MAREYSIEKRPLDLGLHGTESPQAKWWLADENDQHRSIRAVVDGINSRSRGRMLVALVYASLYENIARYGVGPGPISAGLRGPTQGLFRSESLGSGQRSTHNIVKSAVDTVVAKTAKNKPRVKYVTSDGTWTQQQRARQLSQYTDAMFREANVYAEGKQVCRNGCVFGLGAWHVFERDNKVKSESLLPFELVVDDVDGQHGRPRQLHRMRDAARDVIISQFPEKRAQLLETPQAVGATTVNTAADDITVIESWHLPSSPSAGDGRHVISVENCTLLSEPWEKDYFPFVFWRWWPRLSGFWGMGLAEELAGMQLKINSLDKMIVEGVRLMCAPRAFVPKGSLVPGHKVFDYGVIEFKGSQPPIYTTASGMPAEVYQERDGEIQKGYQMPGVNPMQAQGQKPAGLNSAVALREFNDQNSERFALQGESWEEAHIELARVMLDMTRDITKRTGSLPLIIESKRGNRNRRIDAKDIMLEESEFIRRAWPVSQLPQTPEGRLQFVTEIAQAGYIDKDMAMELLQFQDIDDSMSLLTAAFDDAMLCIDSILEDGKDNDEIYPEPYMNLQLTVKLAQSAYLRARTHGAPDDRLQTLRTFIEQTTALQKEVAAQAAAEQAANTNANPATAQPQAPPTSDLLPVAQGAA